MRMRTAVLGLLGSLALIGPATAQVAVGAKAPPVVATELINTKFKSLAALQGRLVLYDYFAHW